MPVKAPLFPTILAATGRMDIVDPPVATAARLCRRENARLHIVHAVTSAGIRKEARWPPQEGAWGHLGAIPSFPMMARRLITLYSDDYPGLTMDNVRIASGVAWEAIFKNADDLASPLIVLGPHVEPPTAKRLPRMKGPLGSTAEGVIRHARCPVMIINRTFEADHLKFKRILVGIDFSRSCISALCLAALLSAQFDSHVHPFHMLPIPPYPKYTPQSLKLDLRRIQRYLDILCQELLQGIENQVFIKTGTIPHAALLRYAPKIEADLIIIGSHTKEKAGKWYPGSVVQQVSFQANCPVLVVNGPEALTPWNDEPIIHRLSAIKLPPFSLFPA